jgi:hypothetical protein
MIVNGKFWMPAYAIKILKPKYYICFCKKMLLGYWLHVIRKYMLSSIFSFGHTLLTKTAASGDRG